MNVPLIWLNEEALRVTHPIFKAAPERTKAIYVWDDGYFRQANYSLKRLIFIYETLCELPIDIIRGSNAAIVQRFAPSTLYVPATNNPLIVNIIASLEATVPVKVVEDEAFVVIKKPTDFIRFFQYWNKSEKKAFLHNGGADA
jgi:hypothetical protein